MKPTAVDLALQAHTPVVCVPLHGQFESLEANGHRFLVAGDGLWIEVRRSWCHLIVPVALDRRVPKPFGRLKKIIDTKVREIPREILDAFIAMAMMESPKEAAAVVIRNNDNGSLRLERCVSIEAGVGSLKAQWAQPMDNEVIVGDLHSHGPIEPYFSGTDVLDTGSEVVIAGVVGGLGTNAPMMRFELFACCLRVPLATLILNDEGSIVECVRHGDEKEEGTLLLKALGALDALWMGPDGGLNDGRVQAETGTA